MSDAESFFDAPDPGDGGPDFIRNGRYYLPNLKGEVVGHTRVSVVAGTLSNKHAIHISELKKLARGMGLNPSLGAKAAAIGIDDPDYSRTLWSVAKDGLAAGGTASGADNGTALHKVLERVDRGEPLENIPEFFHADIKAYQAELVKKGITILPDQIERRVYWSPQGIMGTLDRKVRLSDGTYAILDVKSEKAPADYPHDKTIQFAQYAHADKQMNFDLNQWEPALPVRTDIALIAHIRPGSGECEILQIPIDVGLWGFRVSMESRAWQSLKIPVTVYSPDVTKPVQQAYPPQWPQGSQDPVVVLTDEAAEFVGTFVANAEAPLFDSSKFSPPYTNMSIGEYAEAVGAGPEHLPANPASTFVPHPEHPQWSGLHPAVPPQGASGNGRPAGVPPGTVPMGPAGTPPIWPAPVAEASPALPYPVPPERPPAPTSGSGVNPTERATELIAGAPAGVDAEAWGLEQIESLATLPKPVVQEICRKLGETDENALKKHRKPLAEKALALAVKFRNSATAAIQSANEPTVTVPISEAPDQAVQALLAALNSAADNEAMSNLYQAWIKDFGEGSWSDSRITDAVNRRIMQLTTEVGAR